MQFKVWLRGSVLGFGSNATTCRTNSTSNYATETSATSDYRHSCQSSYVDYIGLLQLGLMRYVWLFFFFFLKFGLVLHWRLVLLVPLGPTTMYGLHRTIAVRYAISDYCLDQWTNAVYRLHRTITLRTFATSDYCSSYRCSCVDHIQETIAARQIQPRKLHQATASRTNAVRRPLLTNDTYVRTMVQLDR